MPELALSHCGLKEIVDCISEGHGKKRSHSIEHSVELLNADKNHLTEESKSKEERQATYNIEKDLTGRSPQRLVHKVQTVAILKIVQHNQPREHAAQSKNGYLVLKH